MMHISGGDRSNDVTQCNDQVIQIVNAFPLLNKNDSEHQLVSDVLASDDDDDSTSSTYEVCSCLDCTPPIHTFDCTDCIDIMDSADEPGSDNGDYSNDSDDLSWRDMVHDLMDNDEEDYLASDNEYESSHDDDNMSVGAMDLIDALSDTQSEVDTHHDDTQDNDNFDIAIEVDMGSTSSYSSRDDDDYSLDDHDFDADVEVREDDAFLVRNNDDYFAREVDSSDDANHSEYYEDNDSRLSFHSEVSSRSRSRSPVALTVIRPNSSSPTITILPTRGQPTSVIANGVDAMVPPPQPPPAVENQQKSKKMDSAVNSASKSHSVNIDEDSICCICLDEDSTHVVVPCGHICLCENCSQLLLSNQDTRKKKCPLCKTKFLLIIKVYK